MKFSYSLLKDYIKDPPPKDIVVEALNLYSFEAEDAGNDTIEVSLQPNRYSDASGHIGIARELAASQGFELNLPDPEQITLIENTENQLPIHIEDPACTRYVAVFADGVSVQKSPEWIQERLEACGIRPINNIVDVMNYVMLEYGQPLHAFDTDKVEGGINVRKAKKEERMTTLDNKDVSLDENILVIADNTGPIAIAGVKGGKRAEVDKKTKRVVIESANFDPLTVYTAGRKLDIKTDAFDRFSHGMSPTLCAAAAERAIQLLKQIGAVESAEGLVDVGEEEFNPSIIDIDTNWLTSFIGMEISKEKIVGILEIIGFAVEEKSETTLRTTSPSWRVDIEHRADVAEEIARLYGFNNIESRPVGIVASAKKNNRLTTVEQTRNILVALGFSESYNYSFVNEKEALLLAERPPITLFNPISTQFTHLRTALLPHLVKNVAKNHRFYERVALFEVGHIFYKDSASEAVVERNSLGIVLSQKNTGQKELFYELKGVLEELMAHIGITEFHVSERHSYQEMFLPGRSAALHINQKTAGVFGIGAADTEEPVAYAELDINTLTAAFESELEYREIPQFPAIERDVSMYVKREVSVADVQSIIFSAGAQYIENTDLLDIYEPDDPEKGRKSLAFRIVFRDNEKTLEDSEATEEMQKIIKALEDELDAEIR